MSERERKAYAIYVITRHGGGIAKRLLDALPEADIYVSDKVKATAPESGLRLPLPMGPLLSDTFTAYDCHVFIISVGAVVRMIAPLLRDKKVDPAIVCVDDTARFSICVLSGHVGRGNAFTERVAAILGAQAVVTTASDALGTLTVDILGRELGWTLDDPDRNVTRGSAAVVNSEPVVFVQEAGEPNFWPENKPLPASVRYVDSLADIDPAAYSILLIASDGDLARSHPAHFANAVIYRPKSLVLGVGCDRGTPPPLVERGVLSILAEQGLSQKCVKAIATIDVKRDEPALIALAERLSCELRCYPAAELDQVPGIENPSATVLRHVGSRGVSEPACLLAAGAERLLVPKRVYTEDGAGRSMTLAVARVPFARRRTEAADV